MIRDIPLHVMVIYFVISLLYGQSEIYDSRKTAITNAIEMVGPAVASINVEQAVSAYNSPDPFFATFFRLKYIL